MQATITNKAQGERGFFVAGALVFVKPGTSTVEVDSDALADIADHPDLSVADDEDGDLPVLAGKNKAALVKIAADEGVEIEDGATNADIVSAIELAREAKA